MAHHLVTPDGEVVLPGAMLHATKGVHAGTHWRLERMIHNGVTHVLRCTRLHRVGRVVMDLHPSVFGLTVVQVTHWYQVSHDAVVGWVHQCREGLVMGALGLAPLAVFEAFKGAEHFHHFMLWVMGGE